MRDPKLLALLRVIALEHYIHKLISNSQLNLRSEAIDNLKIASTALIHTVVHIKDDIVENEGAPAHMEDISVTLLINQGSCVLYGETNNISQKCSQVFIQSKVEDTSITEIATEIEEKYEEKPVCSKQYNLALEEIQDDKGLDAIENNTFAGKNDDDNVDSEYDDTYHLNGDEDVKEEGEEIKIECQEDTLDIFEENLNEESHEISNNENDHSKEDYILEDDQEEKFIVPKTGENTKLNRNKKNILNISKKEMGKCNICGKHITKNNLPSHRKLHTGEKPYSCNNCGKSFSRRIDLKRHKLIHGPREKVECINCGKLLLNKLSLEKHLERGMCEKAKLGQAEKKYKCDICNVLFRAEENLTKHQETFVHDKYTCDTCGKSFFRKKSYERHLKCHSDEKPYSCNLCGLTFKSENYDKKHKEMVHGEKPASCAICGKIVKHERYLKYHMTVHSEERAYNCEECGKTFRRPNGLKKHQIYHHSDERPFSCDVCGKSYKDKQTLDKHKIIHNKEEHFKCDICKRSFSFQSAMHRHYQRVHRLPVPVHLPSPVPVVPVPAVTKVVLTTVI